MKRTLAAFLLLCTMGMTAPSLPALSRWFADVVAKVCTKIPQPSDSPGAGTYSSTQSVTIADSYGGSTLYVCYTTDGSAPWFNGSTCGNGTHYTGAFNISATSTLNAIACATNYSCSPVDSSLYTINTVSLIAHGWTYNTTGTTGTGNLNTTGANGIVITVINGGNSTWPPTNPPTDGKGNTYTPATTYGNTTAGAKFYYNCSATVGTGHSFTNNAGGSTVMAVEAFAGNALSACLDVQNGTASPTGSQPTVQPGSITPGATGEILVSSVGSTSQSTYSINSGFTITDQANTFTPDFGMAYLIDSGSGAINPTWTRGANAVMVSNIIAIKHQ